VPTNTPVPTATMTLAPTPNPADVGLPTEAPGTDVLDFTMTLCQAQWFTRTSTLSCPGEENNSSPGFVEALPGDRQGLETNFPIVLMYPPQDSSETIYGKYPSFTVQKGDRFRAVLACRLHSFCDVDFGLGYYSTAGQTGLLHWPHRFTDSPIVVDYPLDGFAGRSVQFSLSLRGVGNRVDAYGIWLLPHIYRPAP